MIHVLATIHVGPGKRDAFLAEFHELVPTVLAEDGCVEYGPAIDAVTELDAQVTDENTVTVIEKWESLEALQAHLAAPHMVAFRETVKELVTGTELKILQPA